MVRFYLFEINRKQWQKQNIGCSGVEQWMEEWGVTANGMEFLWGVDNVLI